MMFLKKLHAFTILLREDIRKLICGMMSVPTHRSRQFRFAALGIILLTVAIRLPSLLHPLPIDDEAGYSVIANEIVDGGRPYIDAVDRKPPLLFWTYAAAFKVAGEYNWIALHILSLIWTLATMAGLYVIAKQLFDRETGLIAALFYSVFQPWASFKNLAFNGEMVMNLAIVWAWAIGFKRSSLKWRPELLGAGALLCAAFLLKQPAAIAAVPLGIYLLLPSYRISRGLTRTQSVVHAAIFTTGFFGSLALFAVFLQGEGIFRETLYWTIVANTIPYIFWKKGILMTLAFVGACLPLVIGVAATIRDSRGLWAGKKGEQTALLGLLAASAIGTAAGVAFLRALLHPTNSAPQLACRTVLRAALDRTDTVALLVVTTCSHLCLVGGYHCCLLYLALARGCTTRSVRDGTLFARAFCSERQDFRLGQ